MQFDVITLFPSMIEQALGAGVVGRAIERGTLSVKIHDLRAFAFDKHRVVDDVPYGGGPGMVLKPEPIFRALDAVEASGPMPVVILTSPQGTRFTQEVALRLSQAERLVVLCGRYEGVDERVRTRVQEEISIGDYVLSGGELPALVMIDAVARLVPGVVGDEQSIVEESFSRGLLDFPQYTRPAELVMPRPEGRAGVAAGSEEVARLRVPDVLLSGNHADIRRWRKREAIARTLVMRPELLADAALDCEEEAILQELVSQREDGRRT